MILLNDALRIAQDGFLILNHTIRRQPTLRLANRHGTASGMETEAHLCSSLNLIVEARAVGPDIAVIAGSRTAGKHQLGNGRSGADGDRFRRQTSPDGVMGAQPV